MELVRLKYQYFSCYIVRNKIIDSEIYGIPQNDPQLGTIVKKWKKNTNNKNVCWSLCTIISRAKINI